MLHRYWNLDFAALLVLNGLADCLRHPVALGHWGASLGRDLVAFLAVAGAVGALGAVDVGALDLHGALGGIGGCALFVKHGQTLSETKNWRNRIIQDMQDISVLYEYYCLAM